MAYMFVNISLDMESDIYYTCLQWSFTNVEMLLCRLLSVSISDETWASFYDLTNYLFIPNRKTECLER